MTDHETVLAILEEARRNLFPIWRDTEDDEIFRAVRKILFRIGETRGEVNKIIASAKERGAY